MNNINQRFMNYIFGYLTCIILTLSAYFLATTKSSFWYLIWVIGLLAIVQFIVQVCFFLHLSFRKDDRARLMVFLVMTLFVTIIIVGSIWIMNNLNNRMMPSTKSVNSYMNSQDGL